MIKSLVIGAGPAGLLAAWALRSAGAEVLIWDRDPAYHPEKIVSLQYLHEPCGLENRGVRSLNLRYALHPKPLGIFDIEMFKTAIRKDYNRKLGRPLEDENSTRFLWESPVTVWSLKDAYRILHREFKAVILPYSIEGWERLYAVADFYDLVVSTVPLDRLIPEGHWPVRLGRIALNWRPMSLPAETCVYNLEPEVPWYRVTNLDGGVATEFVDKPSLTEALPMLLPLRKVEAGAVIPEHPKNLLLTGRWGSWNPTKLTHHAYADTQEWLRER